MLQILRATPENAAPANNQGKSMKFTYGNGDKPLDGFTIKRGVGTGGFGDVYFAVNEAGKEVALKQIQRNLDVEVRGVKQCMNLKHPNLIALYDIKFDAREQGWIVMEYVSGASLREIIEQNPQGLADEDLRRWFGQIVAGVSYLHDHGIVHRDLKPANIFEDEGIVKIGDYGLSKFISCSRRGGQTESVGTFHYMAPEIGKGEYGKEIDIYALGVILYELATGVVPFDGESTQEIIMKHLTADPDMSRVPSHLRPVIATALHKNPAMRFSDVREMVQALGLEVDKRNLLIQVKDADSPPVVAANNYFASTKRAVQTPRPMRAVHCDEPIARQLRGSWSKVNQWWSDLAIKPATRTLLLVIAIIMFVVNIEWVLLLLVMGMFFYIPYYAVWWLLFKPSAQYAHHTPPLAQQVAGVNVAHNVQPPYVRTPAMPMPQPVAVNRPLNLRQWKVAKRLQLSNVKRSTVLSEVTGSWLGAAAVIGVVSAMAALFQIGNGGRALQPVLITTTWAALVALTCSWIAIALGKRWQREEGDWAIRSFVQLTSGLLIGGVAFLLSDHLMVPWSDVTQQSSGVPPLNRWSGFFDRDNTPLLPAYLAYFSLLMGFVHWWKQVDPLRTTRFSFWAVISSVLAASIVHLLIPFPQPWGAIVAAGTSIAVQLSSPWINSNERHEATSLTNNYSV